MDGIAVDDRRVSQGDPFRANHWQIRSSGESGYEQHEDGRSDHVSPASLGSQSIQGLKHFVGGLHHAGACFVGALRENQIDEFGHDVDIRFFDGSLLNRADTFGASRCADQRIARRSGSSEETATDAIQTTGILKCGELNRAHLGRSLLAGYGDTYRAVVPHRNRQRVRRNRNTWLQRVAVRGHHVTDVIHAEVSGSGVTDFTVRKQNLKKTSTLDREVQGISSEIKIALLLNYFRSGRA